MSTSGVSKVQAKTFSDASNAALLSAAVNEVGLGGLPTITKQNAYSVANFIFGPGNSYSQNVKADLILALVKRIAMVKSTNIPYQNKLAPLYAGMLNYGDTVEEYFVDVADVKDFDPIAAQATVYDITPDKTYCALHSINDKKTASVTIPLNEIPRYFLNEGGVYDFISNQVMSMFNAKEDHEFKQALNLIADRLKNGYVGFVNIPDLTLQNTEDIMSTILEYSQNMTELNKEYNFAGVSSHAPLDNQVLLMTNKFYGKYKVAIRASLFHNDEASFNERTFTFKEIPGFPNVPVILASKDWCQMYFAVNDILYNINAEGAYCKYTLHFWDIISASPFVPVIAFTTDEVGTINTVTVAPASPTIARGGSQVFTATVATTGNANKGVTWSVSGATSKYTRISFDGVLFVGEDESGTLVVKATSVQDTSKSGTTTTITLS